MLPESLWILGAEYDVIIRDDDHFGDAYHGTYDSRKQQINLYADMTESRRAETLLHEVVHALDDALDLGLEERQVQVLSRGLFTVLRDNRDFGEMLIPNLA